MEVKTDDQLLKEAALGLKKNVKNINKEIMAQQTLIEVIDVKSIENTHKIKTTENKFNKAVRGLKKDRRNIIIVILLSIITVLFLIVF